MILDNDDAAVMLEAVGVSAQVGSINFTVLFKDYEQVAEYQSGQVVRTDPYCVANVADIENLGLHGDPDGTEISIEGTPYRITAVDPDGKVFSILTLEAA